LHSVVMDRQPSSARSAPMVVSSQWPVWTTVSSGTEKSLARIEASRVGRSLKERPGRTRPALEEGVAGEEAAQDPLDPVRRIDHQALGVVADHPDVVVDLEALPVE
jgi:hypothetical protein